MNSIERNEPPANLMNLMNLMNPMNHLRPRSCAKSGSTATRRCSDDDVLDAGRAGARAGTGGRRARGDRAAVEAERKVRERRGAEALSVADRRQRCGDRAAGARAAGRVSSGGAIQCAVAAASGRVGDRLMFLPIVNYADGYGLTYGARMSTLDLLGAGERLSVPLTWGGTRRAALELGRTFKRGPLTRVESSVGHLAAREPALRARRPAGGAERPRRTTACGASSGPASQASRSSVDFGGIDDRLWTLAPTPRSTRGPTRPSRATPSFWAPGGPGCTCAVAPARIDLYTTDARGYVGVIGQAVAAGRVQYTAASAPLPAFERLLLGRRLDAARISRRSLRRRSHARDLRRTARANHARS